MSSSLNAIHSVLLSSSIVPDNFYSSKFYYLFFTSWNPNCLISIELSIEIAQQRVNVRKS